jgi:proteasome lid subunit RPN8/RPN11
LILRSEDLASIHAGLARAYPEEGCGVMIGYDRNGTHEVARVEGIANQSVESRARRYLISPEQFLAADRAARAEGLDVLGFFHSHPDHPAEPSAFDREHAWPWYSYLIVSVEKGTVRAQRSFRLREDRSRFEEEPVKIVNAPARAAGGAS